MQLRQRGDANQTQKSVYCVKKETKKECREALNKWWEEKTEKAEKIAKINMKLGQGGSLNH